ncbi:MAG TPA: FAD-dependent monooxygenase, partial [Dehalococcoidia bacterium]|nr:FAD-dependent monooxygenase [Dehalococcoidia bacterium]
MINELYDVALSGYGPTGMAAASLLARRGHRVCVFERWPTLYGLPRMATIDGESARIIQAASDIDAALCNSVARKRYVFANEDGKILIDNDWDKPHVCGFPFRISLHQPDIEDAMDAAARQRGAEINQGWEVCDLDQTGDYARVTARERSSGKERTVRARYVIGADGARSTVRDLLGIQSESWPVRNAWLTFDAKRKRALPNFFGVSPDGRVAAIFCVPGGRAHSIIPLGLNHLRFNFQIDPDTKHDGTLDRQLAYRCIREVYGIGEEDVDIYRQAVYPFEGRLAERW